MSLVAAFLLAISIFFVCVIYVIYCRSNIIGLDDDIEEDGGQRTRIRHEGGI